MKAKVNPEICDGCAVCVDLCPDVFAMNDDNQAYAKVDPIPADLEEACRDAADSCPTDAIEIDEA